ncbi:glycosyltransferase [Mobilitalea sibirica]|uniref:Glycosyltransferase n=1 Tax=Mobilitalea sibirica TaxID=1462919 RepID=A0A8J7H9Z4_9FIRM|nr:glycosyltransferase [Mobilitalea sibirica]MBH1939416.1 glycosyltransferase [Mobilitalea sibirica]
MRVAFINSDLGYGSTGRIVCDLYQEVIKEGNEAMIGYGRECTQEGYHSHRIGSLLSVYSHAMLTRLFDLQGFGSVHATKRFIRRLREYNPDILHLHNLHGSYLNIKLLFEYMKESNKPVIWTLHDCWAFTGHCAYYTYARCNKWKTHCHNCIQKKVYPASFFLDNSSNNYKWKKDLFLGVEKLTITTVSHWLKSQVKQSFLKDIKVRIIPNGIDLELFKPTESDFRSKYGLEGKIVLLGVASIWQERKGLWLFQELAKRLEDPYKIALVGVTEKQKQRLTDKILVLERTNHIKDLVKIYSAADVFLNPSIEETFGMVSLEALACGIPVISNRYSANPELVKEEGGIVVPKLNSTCFIEAIRELMLNPRSKENCRNIAQQYDKNKCYQAYLDLYREVMK